MCAQTLAKGPSGLSAESMCALLEAFNADCLPLVPSQGCAGGAGDQAPLAHLALGLLGEGDMWDTAAAQYEVRPCPRSPACVHTCG